MARLTVVVSQAQGRNPEKRKLEEDIITQLMLARGIDVLVVPHFYDLTADSTAMLALQQIPGHAVVLSWFFPRAAHWLLDRNGIRGTMGQVLLEEALDEEEEEALEEAKVRSGRVADERPLPNRRLYHLDLRYSKRAEDFVQEVQRIQEECSVQLVSLGSLTQPTAKRAEPKTEPKLVGLGMSGAVVSGGNGSGSVALTEAPDLQRASQRFAVPTNTTALPLGPLTDLLNGSEPAEPAEDLTDVRVERLTESAAKRRWYPVIDYSRCTNCMECIDFCLFGVYGVDSLDTILVDQPDNCRKGCPACSRVCPENAIIFPQHKTPAIAGSAGDSSGFKIDLSKLFGAPDEGKSADEIAARERDEHLMLSGRQPVGTSGMKRKSRGSNEPDELDALIDQLDDLDV